MLCFIFYYLLRTQIEKNIQENKKNIYIIKSYNKILVPLSNVKQFSNNVRSFVTDNYMLTKMRPL